MMDRIPVIFDGDMGGDDLWAITMLLANRDRFEVLGLSTVFGNVSGNFATHNALNFLHWLNIKDLPVVQGAELPCDGMRPFGDDAYGTDGVGGYILPEPPQKREKTDLLDWYAGQLRAYEEITVFCTGPATNLANFFQKYPSESRKIRQIIFMGGGIEPPGKNQAPVLMENGDIRKGNITPYAEFNAYQDPDALNILLDAGIPLVFMAADATQHMVLTPARQNMIKALHPVYGPAFHQMLMAVEPLDRAKFGVDGPFIHDPNVVIYALNPELYEGKPLPRLSFTCSRPEDDRRGEALETGAITLHPVPPLWLNAVVDEEAVFHLMLESLRKTISSVDPDTRERPVE